MAFSKGAVFFLLAFFSGSFVIEEGQCQAVSAIAISDGSPIRTFVLNHAGTIVFTSELDGFSSSGTLPRLKTRAARILDSAIMRATLRIGRTGCAALGYSGVSRPCDYSIRLVDTHGGHDTFGEYPLNVNL